MPVITTFAAVKTYLDIAAAETKDDTFFTDRIAEFTSWAQVRTGMSLIQTDDIVRTYDGKGYATLYVGDRPIRAVNSVWSSIDHIFDGTTLIAAADYVVDLVRGRIFRKGNIPFDKYVQNVRVDFDGGYLDADIPAALSGVCIRWCARRWLRRKKDGVASEALGEESKTFVLESELSKDDLTIVDSFGKSVIPFG